MEKIQDVPTDLDTRPRYGQDVPQKAKVSMSAPSNVTAKLPTVL